MCRKSFYSVSFVLVLGMVLTSRANAADASLVGWWKFDETAGTIASDSSGYGNDGTFVGNPRWAPGQINGALEFDGTDDNVYAESVQLPTNAFTFALWFNSERSLCFKVIRINLVYGG